MAEKDRYSVSGEQRNSGSRDGGQADLRAASRLFASSATPSERRFLWRTSAKYTIAVKSLTSAVTQTVAGQELEIAVVKRGVRGT